MISQVEHRIFISAIGNFDATLLKAVSREVSDKFGIGTETRHILKNVDFALDKERNQYFSTPILERLARKAPPPAMKVLAITHVDLFIPVLTYVYGEAQLGGKACLISTFRLKKDLPPANAREVFLKRVVK